MIEITYVDNKMKVFSTATKYDIVDDWYVLMDDDGKEKGRAVARKVRDIEQVDEDEWGARHPWSRGQRSACRKASEWAEVEVFGQAAALLMLRAKHLPTRSTPRTVGLEYNNLLQP